MAVPSLVRSIGTTAGNPDGRRGIYKLSTVSGALFAIIGDINQAGVTGDGGDNTGIAKIYVYYSTDGGSTWVIKWTITTDVTSTNLVYTATIDAQDNVHVAWRSNNYGMKYQYALWNSSAATLTAQTAQTLYTPPAAGYGAHAPDIDTIGDASTPNYAVVAFDVSSSVTGSKSYKINHYFIKANTVYTLAPITISSTDTEKFNQVTIAALHNTVASSTGIYVIVAPKVLSVGGDLGDFAYIVRVNTSTGALISAGSQIPIASAGKGAGLRTYRAFSSENTNVFTIAGMWSNTSAFLWRFTVDTSGNRNDIIPQRTQALINTSTVVVNDVGEWATFARNENGAYTYITYWGRTQGYTYSLAIAKISSTGGVTWEGNNSFRADSVYYNIKPGQSIALSNRNVGSQWDMLEWHNAGAVYQVHYQKMQLALAGVVVSPSGTIGTSTPTLTSSFKLPAQYGQSQYKMVWQLATDPAFTTNVRQFTQDDTKFIQPISTDPVNKVTVTASDVLPQTLALPVQGTWYVRSAAIDFYGNVGDWSPTVTFTVAHPPVAVGLIPNLDSVIVYGGGTIFFDWTFTDPYKYDNQTAYEVVVTEASSGAVIVDTGKISSTTSSATVAIPSSWKDDELQWTVSLWDGNDTQGPYVSPQTFYVSDPPAPVIVFPSDGSTITTGIPTVQWAAGVGTIKTQNGYRVILTQGSKVLWDTGWRVDSGNAAVMPGGLIHNGNSYSLQVQIRDSLGMTGQTTITFATSWIVPAQPPVYVFAYELDRKGFLYVGWESMSTDDPDFFAWNLYRRQYGDTSWTLLETVTDLLPCNGYQDFNVAANVTYQYMVTQVVNRFGDIIESLQTVSATIKTVGQRYWLMDTLGITPAVPLFNVTGDTYSDEHEEAVFAIIGAGRHVELGETLGATGSLDVQCRTHFVGFSSGINYLLNPGMQSHIANNSPDYWTISTIGSVGTVTLDYQQFMEPAPNGDLYNLFVTVDQIGGTSSDAVTFAQDIPVNQMPPIAASGQFNVGCWLALNPDASVVQAGFGVSVQIDYLNAANTIVATDTAAAAVTENYQPSGTDYSTGRWARYTRTVTAPNGSWNHIRVTFRVTAGASSDPQFYWGGGHLFNGGVATGYFDGDMKGCFWNGVPYASVSISNGAYLARDQRLDVQAYRELNRPCLVRNPFGDVWQASLGDVSVTHIAGTGSSDELSDLSIPYREVGS